MLYPDKFWWLFGQTAVFVSPCYAFASDGCVCDKNRATFHSNAVVGDVIHLSPEIFHIRRYQQDNMSHQHDNVTLVALPT